MRLLVAALLLLLGGCVSLPPLRTVACQDARRPQVALSADGRTASVELDVLTYNVEGLPRPARRGRGANLRRIGEHLAGQRAEGRAPDIVLFQEVFSRSAREAALAAGYPSLTPGPQRTDQGPRAVLRRPLPGRPNPRRGELGVKLASSGLLIASEYPILAAETRPFARGSCAGLDCLASKGVAFARIAVPGVPGTVDLFNTHMNARKASRVRAARNLAAHNRQAAEVADFIQAASDPRWPVIFGGDFNMRRSPERFEGFERFGTLTLVHQFCTERPRECEVRASWDGDAPWMDTQDLQLFRSGGSVAVRPVMVEAMFDGGERGPRLSDHDGLRVRFRLSWPAEATPADPCAAART